MKFLRRFILALAVGVLVSTGLVLFNDTALHIPTRILAMVILSAVALTVAGGVFEVRSWRTPTPEEPPITRIPSAPKSPVEKAIAAMDNANDISSRTERKVRIRIDTEDAHND